MGGRYGDMELNIVRLKELLDRRGEMTLGDVARELGLRRKAIDAYFLLCAGQQMLLYQTDDNPIRIGILRR